MPLSDSAHVTWRQALARAVELEVALGGLIDAVKAQEELTQRAIRGEGLTVKEITKAQATVDQVLLYAETILHKKMGEKA